MWSDWLSSLIVPFVFNAAIGAMVMIAFTLVADRYRWCYKARIVRTLPDDPRQIPPDIPIRSIWRWVRSLFHFPETMLIATIGLDSYMYLRFLQFAAKFFGSISIVCCVVIIPINIWSNPVSMDDASTNVFNTLTMNNIQSGSHILWIHVVCAYLFSGILLRALHTEWNTYVDLRHRYFLSVQRSKVRPDQLSVLIRNIPRDLCQTPTSFNQWLSKLYPALKQVSFANAAPRAQACFEKRQEAVHNLEVSLMSFLLSNVHKRPVYRPIFGIYGPASDAIDLWTKKIDNLNQELLHEATSTFGEHGTRMASAFVTFSSFFGKELAIQIPPSDHLNGLRCEEAPGPSDLYRNNLDRSATENFACDGIVHLAVFAQICFWTIPVGLFSALANVDTLSSIPFVNSLLQLSPWIKGILTGFLPNLGILIVQLLLPPTLFALARLQGTVSHSQQECFVFKAFFVFNFVNGFLVVVIGSSAWTVVQKISENIHDIPAILSEGVSNASNSFTNYIILQSFLKLPLMLLRIVPLLVGKLTLGLSSVLTPFQVLTVTDPGRFPYAQEYPLHMFVFILGITYCVISPILVPFCAMFFCLSSVANRFLFVFVHESTRESGGFMFSLVFVRLVFGLVLSQLTLLGMFGLRGAPIQSAAMLILVIFTGFIYNSFMNQFDLIGSRLSMPEIIEIDTLLSTGESSISEPPASLYVPEWEASRSAIVDTEKIRTTMEQMLVFIQNIPKDEAVRQCVHYASTPCIYQKLNEELRVRPMVEPDRI